MLNEFKIVYRWAHGQERVEKIIPVREYANYLKWETEGRLQIVEIGRAD